jgi:tRNA-uridine 2-sulfurtransferase
MFSGGLDSTIAAHLLKQQGLDVVALHFILPFYSGVGNAHASIRQRSQMLQIPLRIEEEGDDFLAMFKDPAFGFGKNINPCLDCRIHRLEKAKSIMHQEGASFIATGEVVGQRPMSQRRDCLDTVAKKTGLHGYLLRPLSARILRPTIPEEKGWVDRDKLLSIGGRGRKDQIAYAKAHGLSYPSPGGGCILTYKETVKRFEDLDKCSPDFSLSDFKLLAYGRHYRLHPELRLVVARDDSENNVLENLVSAEDYLLTMHDVLGPLGVLRGRPAQEDFTTACRILARHSKARKEPSVRVAVLKNGESSIITIKPAADGEYENRRI